MTRRRLSMVIWLAATATLLAGPAAVASTWYVDAAHGNDSASGRSPAQAWRTLQAANQAHFGPGDCLLLKAGCRYPGTLILHGSGSPDAPARVGRFSDGSPPLIDGQGAPAALRLDNGSNWIIEDLEITNAADDHKSRDGLVMRSNEGKVDSNITLRRLHIHHVRGHDERGGGCGILVEADNGPDKTPSRFDGVLIEHCLLNDVPFNGIFVHNWDCRNRDASGNLVAPITHLIIRDNLLYDVAGDAICIITTKDAVIEHNEVYRSSLGQTRGAKTPSAGIWPRTSDGTVMRFNRVEGLRGMFDGLAFDVDIDCNNTLVEHNLSRNNGNGFLLVCGIDDDHGLKVARTSHTVVRENMSLNDAVEPGGSIIELVSFIRDVIFDNNVFVRDGAGKRTFLLGADWLGGTWPQQITFRHNIVSTQGELGTSIGKTTGLVYASNLWNGKFSPLPTDPAGVKGDPHFVSIPLYKTWDSALADDSPARRIGFKPFSLKDVGLPADTPRMTERDQTLKLNPPESEPGNSR